MKIKKRELDKQAQGADAQPGNRREEDFYTLAEQFRRASDPSEVERLGHRPGRLVFGK
jgi:hypothetical protein